MKRIITIFLLTAIPFLATAQGTVNELEKDFGARLSVGIDKKIVKGLHVSADAEARLSDNFSSLGRYQLDLGVTYKINKTFKIGAGYTFIEKLNSSDEWKPRHRFYVSGMAGFRVGSWRLSLKETLQYTHRDVNNTYQKNPDRLTLKSRFKAAYKGSNSWEPYGYIELRTVLNDPACSATWSTTSLAYSDYSFKGYTDTYFNRYRAAIGTEYKINKHNKLDFRLIADYKYDKNIDTNKAGTRLKSLTYDQKFNLGVGIGYTFSF